MTTQVQENQENRTSDKELNFRALEAKLHQERNARLELEKKLHDATNKISKNDDEDSDDEPYVDHKRLEKKLNKFGQNTQSEIQKGMELAKQAAKEELKHEIWLENNPDFHDVLQQHADKLLHKAPELAKIILRMPEGVERQKLVYQNIKELGLNKPEVKQPSIQETIDAKKRSPYYQPSGVGASPYTSVGDFSSSGQKQAYEKMQQLKAQLRI